MIISSSCLRRFGHFQLSRRGLSQYILVCALLSTLTLSVITLRLFGHLYFTRPKPGVAKSLSFQTSIGRISNVFQLPGPNLRLRSKPPRNFSKGLIQLQGRDFSGSDLDDLQQAVLSSAILTWDYHRNTTRPRSWFNCSKLIQADKNEQLKYQAWFAKQHQGFATLDEDIVPMMTSNCSIFKTIRGYSNTTGTAVEREYPIAYVILVHRRFEHLERLVRALYRPQHSFCIHIDSKASYSLKRAVFTFAQCFPNVHLAPRPQRIVYAHVSRLVADIVCMEELLRRDSTWKYLINFASTELPIRTNFETAQILDALQGLNDIHETYEKRVVSRFDRVYKIVDGRMKATDKAMPPAPHNITVVKGQAYNTFSRPFLEWLFKDQRSRDLLVWSAQTYSPDEHYWATLNDLYHNPHLESPGGFADIPERKGYITKFILWAYTSAKYECRGKAVHSICNFNALDLPTIIPRYHLAANKYDLTYDPVAYACMEELLENRTLTPDPAFDKRDYESLYFVRTSRKKSLRP
ncbi:beta-1,3-galactosyl-o-glycosyl-glycoprotein beta-1,6-n-acetylglucosaminyltransferase-like [Plakobranchus ocellatus]|uniref:Beta-1,3-galactosyl-o-glycosyl-glycoprotein beta-1,6-n-acetylglucosaminyltransferase-like n=1 Tax=Plakobranchus ocellatus TaxID=259542 RepID=A0AAV4CAT6_9GAST|nr:beta-1,3-galactosyl-o-glycosyl-glycoprotein beta-1,6-n-acetylglucosaminyltransferase-like [Plakobranchus ocellatus]